MIDVFFATNRDMSGGNKRPVFGTRFHKDGPRFYRVGCARMKRTESDDPDALYALDSVTLVPEAPQGEKKEPPSSHALFAALQAEMRKNERDVIIYLHGFANSVESSLSRAAQLSEIYQITNASGETYDPYIFAFLWPSNGKVQPPWHYFSDRNDAEDSGKAMARALLRLMDFLSTLEASEKDGLEKRVKCQRRLHLVAHSMGNWALRHAVQALREQLGDDGFRPIFENAFLMAADEDDDALEPQNTDKLALLPRLARRIHVYHSSDDLALIVSDKTKFNRDRLGFNGPRSFTGLSTRISAIDCVNVDRTKTAHGNHQYYRLRPEVIADVKAVLSGVRPDNVPGREIIEGGYRYRLVVTK